MLLMVAKKTNKKTYKSTKSDTKKNIEPITIPAKSKIEFEKPMTTAPLELSKAPAQSTVQTLEEKQNTEKTLNMIYGGLGIVVIVAILIILMSKNIGKENSGPIKNLGGNYTANGTLEIGRAHV